MTSLHAYREALEVTQKCLSGRSLCLCFMMCSFFSLFLTFSAVLRVSGRDVKESSNSHYIRPLRQRVCSTSCFCIGTVKCRFSSFAVVRQSHFFDEEKSVEVRGSLLLDNHLALSVEMVVGEAKKLTELTIYPIGLSRALKRWSKAFGEGMTEFLALLMVTSWCNVEVDDDCTVCLADVVLDRSLEPVLSHGIKRGDSRIRHKSRQRGFGSSSISSTNEVDENRP